MAVHLDRIGAESPPSIRTWVPRDCSLYALALGASFDRPAYTLDRAASSGTASRGGEPQKVYPTFALTLMAAEASSWPDPVFSTGDFDLHNVVLGDQSLVCHRPLVAEGAVSCRTRVAGIYDKGSGALVRLELVATDTDSGVPAFTASAGLFVIGEGGFGGERGPSAPPWQAPERPPDHLVTYETLPIQSLLYRHAGNDPNLIHVDAAFAREAGLEGPILTGQNTLGYACRAIVERVAEDVPGRCSAISGRFAAVAYNGDTISTEIWRDEADGASTSILFRVRSQRGDVLVDHGRALLS